MVIALSKVKASERKWISTVCGKEVDEKYKSDHIKSFTHCESTEKTECAEDLEIFLTKSMEESGAMEMSNFKKRH